MFEIDENGGIRLAPRPKAADVSRLQQACRDVDEYARTIVAYFDEYPGQLPPVARRGLERIRERVKENL